MNAHALILCVYLSRCVEFDLFGKENFSISSIMIDETHVDNQKSPLSNGISADTENHQSETENNVSQIHFSKIVRTFADIIELIHFKK